MFDANRLLFDLIGGEFSGSRRQKKRYRRHSGGFGGGLGRAALSPQGLTILGGLALAAYEHLKEKKQGDTAPFPEGGAGGPAAPPLVPPPFPGSAGAADRSVEGEAAADRVPAPPLTPQERALVLVEAMVAAAQADGRIDPEERVRILDHLASHGENDEARAFVEQAMAGRSDLERLAARVGDPMFAAEVYAASLLAIDPDTPAEQAYLATLATKLHLDPQVVRALEARLDARNDEGDA